MAKSVSIGGIRRDGSFTLYFGPVGRSGMRGKNAPLWNGMHSLHENGNVFSDIVSSTVHGT